jgi:hypothetical protein
MMPFWGSPLFMVFAMEMPETPAGAVFAYLSKIIIFLFEFLLWRWF